MAGKIIVRGFKFVFGKGTVTLLIDGVATATVSKKESVEIPITHTCVISTHCGASTPATLQVKNGTEVELQILNKSGKLNFDILRETVITPNAPDVDPGTDVGKKPIYNIVGAHGRSLLVYEDKCIISTRPTVGSFISGNISDGDKTIYYSDVIGVQYKKPGYQLGYLQLETSSALMNNRQDNFFNENSFTFDEKVMVEVEKAAAFIKKSIEAIKTKPAATATPATVSAADELKKFKELLDLGIITQEEFDAKKKDLLGL